MQKITKPASAWNLAGRAFVICFAFLIIPLFIHSFFQYRREIHIVEQNTRSSLQAAGWQMGKRIEDLVVRDWAILSANCSGFPIQHVAPRHGKYAFIDGSNLVVGMDGLAFTHPLQEVLALKETPFPMNASFSPDLQDEWIESFQIHNTELTLYLGTKSSAVPQLQWSNLIFRIGSFVLLFGIMGSLLVLLLLRLLTKPFNVLCRTMERVALGAVHSRYVKQRFGFEINDLGGYFNETVEALLEHQKQAEEERLQKERLAQTLKVAQEIQADLLPKKFPTIPTLDIGAAYLPALEVGGDFYDILPLSSGKVLIVVADIADKGISACLFSLGLRSSLRALAEAQDDLGALVKKANELFLLDAEESSQFATVWLGILDGKRLNYVSLGHPPALLKRGGGLIPLSSDHPSLGLPLKSVVPQTVDLESGDILFVYSDGAFEAHDVHDVDYGAKRLKDSFLHNPNTSSQALADQMLLAIQQHSHGVAQYDDLTLLFIRSI